MPSDHVETREKNEERLQLALEGSGAGMWDYHPATDHVVHDDNFLGMLGYGPSELSLTHETWLSLLHPEDRPGFEALLERFVNGTGERFESEFRVRAKDGRWRVS